MVTVEQEGSGLSFNPATEWLADVCPLGNPV